MAQFPYARTEEVKKWLKQEKQYFLCSKVPEDLQSPSHRMAISAFGSEVSYFKYQKFVYFVWCDCTRTVFSLDKLPASVVTAERLKAIDRRRKFFHYPAVDHRGELIAVDFLPGDKKNFIRLWDFNKDEYVEARFFLMKKRNQCKMNWKTHYLVYDDEIHYFDADRFYKILQELHNDTKRTGITFKEGRGYY